MHHAPRVVLLKLVEGFIVSVDSAFGYLVARLAACYWEVPALVRSWLSAHLAACSWEVPSLARSWLEIDGMKASILERLESGWV